LSSSFFIHVYCPLRTNNPPPCCEAKSLRHRFASPKWHPGVASSPLPLFPFPLTVPPPLLFDTASPPCSDPLPRRTSSPHRTQQHGPRRHHSPSSVQQRHASTSDSSARLERWSRIHPRGDPLAANASAGGAARYALSTSASHDFFLLFR
jgi:hypothetical protein